MGESLCLELFKKRGDLALTDMIESSHRHGLVAGLHGLRVLSHLNDSMILWGSTGLKAFHSFEPELVFTHSSKMLGTVRGTLVK